MNETVNPLFFFTFLKTREEATEFHEHLGMLSNHLFTTSDSVEHIINTALPYQKVELLKNLATEYHVDLQNKAQLQELIQKIDEAVMLLPVVQLTVAIDPKLALLDAMHQWFFKVFQQAVLLDVGVNASLIGGSQIRFNGKMADYSLRQLITENLKPKE